MKKFAILLAISTMVISFASISFADGFNWDKPDGEAVNFKVSASWVNPNDNALKSGYNIEGLVSYDIWGFLALGIETGYTRIDVEASGIDFGHFNCFPVMGDIILKAPYEFENFKATPYIVNGFGALITDFTESSAISGVAIDSRTGFLYKLGGGLDFYLMDWLGLNFEVSYQWAKVDLKASAGSTSLTGSQNMDALYLGGGVIISF